MRKLMERSSTSQDEYIIKTLFVASHCLSWWGPDHECAKLHSHHFKVKVVATGYSDSDEVVDLSSLRDAVDFISNRLAGHGLMSVENVSCEGICDFYRSRLESRFKIKSVTVMEDGRTGVRVKYA